MLTPPSVPNWNAAGNSSVTRLLKATLDQHGSDVGWDPSLAAPGAHS